MLRGLGRFLQSGKLARFYSVADQAAQGVANIVATALLGRCLPSADFGALGLALGTYYVVAGFQRSAIVLPYIVEQERFETPADERKYHADWWWLNVLGSVLLVAALLLLAGALNFLAHWYPPIRWGVTPLCLAAGITPPLLWAEHVRRWLFKIERADLVGLVSGGYAVALIATAFTLPGIRNDAVSGAVAWIAAGLVATFLPLLLLRPVAPRWSRSLDCFRRHRRFAVWLALTNLPYMVYSSATVVVFIGMLNGPAAAAVFTAARTLANPAVSLMSAVDSVDKPKAAKALAEQGVAGLRKALANTRGVLMLTTGLYLAVVALFAPALLHLAFHDRYADIVGEVRWLALAIFLFCLSQPSETLLIILRVGETMFLTRTITAVITIAALVAGGRHGVQGMAVGLAIAFAINLLVLMLVERRVSAIHATRVVPV